MQRERLLQLQTRSTHEVTAQSKLLKDAQLGWQRAEGEVGKMIKLNMAMDGTYI